MPLTQAEADALLQMPKAFVDAAPLDFSRTQPLNYERLISDYLRWLREGLRVSEHESSCRIATPFLDRHNDEIEIYVERRDGGFLLTDDGYTIADLRASGMAF